MDGLHRGLSGDIFFEVRSLADHFLEFLRVVTVFLMHDKGWDNLEARPPLFPSLCQDQLSIRIRPGMHQSKSLGFKPESTHLCKKIGDTFSGIDDPQPT